MSSGIFLLGGDLKFSFFQEVVEPYITGAGLTIPDKTSVPSEGYCSEGVLLSLRGEGLEKNLSTALLEAFKKEKENVPREYEGHPESFWTSRMKIIDYSYPGGVGHLDEGAEEKKIFRAVYKTIGVYEDNKAASGLFLSVALPHYLERANKSIGELEERLEGLANSTVRSFGSQ